MPMDATERGLAFPLPRARRAFATPNVDSETKTGATPLSDEELIERVRKGDEGASLALFRRYERLAHLVGLRILQDEGEAEDLAQEIFLRLVAECDTFDKNRGSARTWLIQMIYRRAFDRRAYLRRRQFYVGTNQHECTNTVNGTWNAEEDMIDRLTVGQLKAAFGELSDRQRETLEAFFFEGLTFAEIAKRTGQDLTNVRHHYYRGLERLRQSVRKIMGQKDRSS